MQSKQWKHPGSAPGSLPPKKFKRVHSAGKVMAALFWDSKGVIMVYYLEQGSTINGTILCGQIETDTPEIVRRMRGQLDCCVLLLHTSQVAMTAVIECGFEILPRLPYSPDMAPSDF